MMSLENNPDQEYLRRIFVRSRSHLIKSLRKMKLMSSNMSSQHSCLSIPIPQKILTGNQLSWRSRLIRWSYLEVNIRIPKTAGMIIQIHGNTVVSKAVLISMVWDSRLHTESTRADATRIFLLIHLRHWWNRCIYAKERTANIVKRKV